MAKAKAPRTTPKRVLLSAESLGDLSDGLAGQCIDREIEAIYADIKSRGFRDGKARTLTITVTMTPTKSKKDGDNPPIHIDLKAASKLPPRAPYSTVAKMDEDDGAMVFNPDSADNPDQMTTNDLLPEDDR